MFKDKQEIIEYIQKAAPQYVPEWHFDPTDPDLGGAFAIAFAEMLEETIKKYDQVWDKQHKVFLNMMGQGPLPEAVAESIIVLELAAGALSGSFVPEGTRFTDEGGKTSCALQAPLYVSPVSLESVYCAHGKEDKAYKAFGKAKAEPINLFDFKEKDNVLNHVLYIKHTEAFHVNTNVRLEMTFTDKHPDTHRLLSDESVVRWEYWSGQWEPFKEVSEGGEGIALTWPEATSVEPLERYGHRGIFIRCVAIDINQAAEITFDCFKVNIEAEQMSPTKMYHGDVEVDNTGFYPFGKTLLPFDTFFLAAEEAFSKKGAYVELSWNAISTPFDLGEIPEGIPIDWKPVIEQSRFKEQTRPHIEITDVSLEYWNGKDFVKMHTEKNQSVLYSYSDQLESKTIGFYCPEDMEKATFNGISSYWLRIRILEVKNLYKGWGTIIVPYWQDLGLSYQYNKRDFRPELMAVENNGSSWVMEKSQYKGRPFVPFEEELPSIYFGFDKAPTSGPFGVFIENAFEIHNAIDYVTYMQYTENGWKNILPKDETNGLKKTGTISLPIEIPWKSKELFGENLFWIKIQYQTGNNQIHKICVKKVFLNAGKILYTGPEVHLLEGAMNKMPMSIGYISKAFNPIPLIGGIKEETQGQSMERKSAMIRHRNRAVTGFDIEALAYEAYPSMLKCKCFDNVDCLGNKKHGTITLVYIPENYNQKSSISNQEQQIRSYICQRGSPLFASEEHFFVKEAIYVEVSVYASIQVDYAADSIKSEEEVSDKLVQFLHPITGNFFGKGFEIGRLLDENMIDNFLYSLKGIKNIEKLYMSGFVEKEGKKVEIDLEEIRENPFVISISGKHKIIAKL